MRLDSNWYGSLVHKLACGRFTTAMTIIRTLSVSVIHAGSFSVNRRRRAQNGTGVAAFGGVGREISNIHIPIFFKGLTQNSTPKLKVGI